MPNKNFTELFTDLLDEVTSKDHGLFKGMDTFYKGIGEMEWEDLMAGGQALRTVKENLALTMVGTNAALGDRRKRWIEKIEKALKVRVTMLANEPLEIINLGMTRWEEAVAIFGLAFFNEVETAGATAPIQQNNPSNPNGGITEEKMKEMFTKTEGFIEDKFKGIRRKIDELPVPKVKIPISLILGVWGGVLSIVGLAIFIVFFMNPTVKDTHNDLSVGKGSVKHYILYLKSKAEAHDKSLKQDSIALASIKDTLDIRLPKAKVKK